MAKNLGEVEFDYMWEDDVISHVKRYEDGHYDVINYMNDEVIQPFRNKKACDVTDEDLLKFFEKRCLPRTRVGLMDALESIGLYGYDPYLIVLKAYGVLFGDCFWIRFKGVDKTYKEVLVELEML